MMERAPLTKQRSPWHESHTELVSGVPTVYHHRRVGDGTLWAMVADEPWGWHMSISFRDRHNELTRYPTWDEIAHARDELLPADVNFVMHLPTADQYVAVHDTCFHIHEHPERSV
jgi:hypothetical protein